MIGAGCKYKLAKSCLPLIETLARSFSIQAKCKYIPSPLGYEFGDLKNYIGGTPYAFTPGITSRTRTQSEHLDKLPGRFHKHIKDELPP